MCSGFAYARGSWREDRSVLGRRDAEGWRFGRYCLIVWISWRAEHDWLVGWRLGFYVGVRLRAWYELRVGRRFHCHGWIASMD